MMRVQTAVDAYRNRVATATGSLFAHARYPLENTLSYHGDPGLFGPGSPTWTVIGDVSTFVGGLRALLLQAAHPEVAAGMADHSQYREDPLGRLSRTSAYVTATAFGARPEVEAAVAVVRHAHQTVVGTSHRGTTYRADAPPLAAWVHNSLTEGFLVAYQVFGPRRLTAFDADVFVAEQARVGRLLEAHPLPETAGDLERWIADHNLTATSPGMSDALAFLRSPPLPVSMGIGYRVLFWAAVATLPRRLRSILGVRKIPGAITLGRILTRALRWTMGSPPSWHLALIRMDAAIPPGLFRQPLPPTAPGVERDPAA